MLILGAAGCASQADARADNAASALSAEHHSDAHPQSAPSATPQSTDTPASPTENPSDTAQPQSTPSQGASSTNNDTSAATTETAEYENDYFTLDVPDNWEGAWELNASETTADGITIPTFEVSVDYRRVNPNYDGGGMVVIGVLPPEAAGLFADAERLGTTTSGMELRVIMAAGGGVIGQTPSTATVSPK